jgi:hypothetical protein
MNKLEQLLSISSKAFARTRSISLLLSGKPRGELEQVQSMLDTKNGFAAFESALIVFPTIDTTFAPSIDSWNEMSGWRDSYRGFIPDDVVFFAEDLFGGQFGALQSEIVRLDPESGEIHHYAKTLLDWSERLLENYPEDTGWPLAHEWQVAKGPILSCQRLLPIQPFILGGDYIIENMTLVDSHIAMENWGRLFQAVKSVPDGQVVTISGWLERES